MCRGNICSCRTNLDLICKIKILKIKVVEILMTIILQHWIRLLFLLVSSCRFSAIRYRLPYRLHKTLIRHVLD